MESIGINVHKRDSQVCILGEGGEVVLEQRVRTQRERLGKLLGKRPKPRVLLEASTESEWVARYLEEMGHEVVAHVRPARRSLPAAECAGIPGRRARSVRDSPQSQGPTASPTRQIPFPLRSRPHGV